MIFTYSPNWYRAQCVHFTTSTMLYSSNYSLYQCGVEGGGVRAEVCFREMAIIYGLNHKDIKVNAIASVGQSIVVGVNQPCIFVLEQDSLQVMQAILLEGFSSVEYLHVYEEQGQEVALVCNRDGAMVKCYLRQPKLPLQPVNHKIKPSPVKAIYRLNHQHCAVVFTRGTLLIYDSNFNQLLKHVQISSHDTVYSVDCIEHNNHTYCCFLTRSKDNHTITVFRLSLEHQFPLQFKKKVEEVGVEVHRFNLNWHYPKQMSEKVKNAAKASLSVKLLDGERVLVTGRFGEVAEVKVGRVGQGGNLIIKPFSHQVEEGPYYLWPDSHHYKEIYHIEAHQGRLYFLSTDHNLSVWLATHQQPKHLYSYKFLTAAVSSFLPVPHDRHTLMALLKDSALRSWEWEEGGRQLNEYWKFSKKYRVVKAVCHPVDEGVMGLVTACHRIQIYDIYEDRLIKLLEIGEEVLNISFEDGKIRGELQGLLEGQFVEAKYNCGSLFDRKLDPRVVLLAQLGKKLVIVEGLGEHQIQCWAHPREKRLERVHGASYWDGRMLLASQANKQVINVWCRFEGKQVPHLSIPVKMQQSRVMFKVEEGSKEVRVISFKGSKMAVWLCQPGEEGWNVLGQWQLNFQHPIDYLHLPYAMPQAVIYSQRDDCLTILQLGKLKQSPLAIEQASPEAKMLLVDHKLDTLMLWGEQLLAMATKHQTIKVVPINSLIPWHKVQFQKKQPITSGTTQKEEKSHKDQKLQVNPVQQKKLEELEQKQREKIEKEKVKKVEHLENQAIEKHPIDNICLKQGEKKEQGIPQVKQSTE